MTSDCPPTADRTLAATGVPVSSAPLAAIPDRGYAVTVVGAGLTGAVLGGLVAGLVGASVVQAVAIGAGGLMIALVGLLPVVGRFLITPATWGLAVMAATAAQFLVAIMVLMVMAEAFGLPKKPVVFGVLIATFMVLMAETVCAVVLLARRDAERLRAAEAVGGGTVDGAGAGVVGGAPAGRYA